jgi:hypothetical protein
MVVKCVLANDVPYLVRMETRAVHIEQRQDVLARISSAHLAACTNNINGREHVAGDVPSRSWKGQYGKS